MKKILFIEDEAALQKTLASILNSAGYEVLSALNGEIGLRLAKSEKPDLILLDLILPRLNGFDVLKKLKTEAATDKIPVIILTNLEEASQIEKALALGATTYLVKANYNLEEVVEKVKKAINS